MGTGSRRAGGRGAVLGGARPGPGRPVDWRADGGVVVLLQHVHRARALRRAARAREEQREAEHACRLEVRPRHRRSPAGPSPETTAGSACRGRYSTGTLMNGQSLMSVSSERN